MSVINTNIGALRAANASNKADRMLGSASEAEDVVQDAWLRARQDEHADVRADPQRGGGAEPPVHRVRPRRGHERVGREGDDDRQQRGAGLGGGFGLSHAPTVPTGARCSARQANKFPEAGLPLIVGGPS